MLNASNDTNE